MVEKPSGKLEHGKLRLGIRCHAFLARMVRHWKELPVQAVESPSL